MIKNFVVSVSLLALAACGPVSDSQTSQIDAGSSSKSKITLTPGYYLVSASRLEMCSPGAVTLMQKIEYASFAGTKTNRVILSVDRRITDNFVRMAVCRSGTLSGTAYLNISYPTVVELEGMKLDAVEKVTELEIVKSPVSGGRYIVGVRRVGMCADRLINLNQALVYHLDTSVMTLNSVTLALSSHVETNEITTLECKRTAVDSGETLVNTGNSDGVQILGKDLTVTSVLKVVKSEKVFPKK